MATLEELISTISYNDYLHDIQFIIDENLRTVAVPSEGVVLGVVGDKNTNRVNFIMPRNYNGFDMSKFSARIKYSNANNKNNYYLVNDITIEGTNILFSWLVNSDVTESIGEVRFVVELTKSKNGIIENAFNTTIAVGKILEGLTITDKKEIEPIHDYVVNSTGENPNCDSDIPRIYFTGDTTLMTKERSVDLGISYRSKNLNFDGTANVKWQGNSSLNYNKKNYTIKLYKDSKKEENLNIDFKDWGAFNKFVLKANYIDYSHARNIVSARIWSNVVSERSNYSELPKELTSSPNNGAVDGFFVKVYINGSYTGRYTLNYGKDSIMWNMDETNKNHAALCGENYVSGCFNDEAIINGNDWSLEFPKVLNNDIKTSFNNAIYFVMESSDEEFVSNIKNYFDLESLIDYYIFAYVSCGLDSMGKNQIYLTYDTQHWIASMYDMDSTWGLYWDGESFVSSSYKCQDDYESGIHSPDNANLLYTRLASLFDDKIKERYWYLRERSLSIPNIIDEFEQFMSPCSEALASKDVDLYTIPSHSTNNLSQISEFVSDRIAYVDNEMFVPLILKENFSPNGKSWEDKATVNFDNDRFIEAKIDSIGSGTNECLLSIGCGSSIDDWYNDGSTLHLYTTETDDGCKINIDVSTNDESSSYAQNSTTVTLPLTVKLDKEGLYFNNSLYVATSSSGTYETIISDILDHTSIIVGSKEGDERSNAHYEYIKVG